jgi:glycosyltransferase involved in cell wall biosynthesis
LSDTDIPHNVGDYRLMDRKIVDVIRQLPEKDRFMKGLYCWPGYRSACVEYERPTRANGYSKFNFWQLWNFALNGLTSFSTLPIRAGIYLGFLISFLSFLYALFIVTKTIVFGIDVPGYASMMVTMLFLGGIQLFFLGLLGEYIGRIFKEVKNRPLYVVQETIGLNSDRQ